MEMEDHSIQCDLDEQQKAQERDIAQQRMAEQLKEIEDQQKDLIEGANQQREEQ